MSEHEHLIEGLDAVGDDLRRCILTIGNFDGVHLGHQKIIHAVRALGDKHKRPVVALTFQPPPEMVLRPSVPPHRILPHARKCRLLLAAGADYVVTAAADRGLLDMSAKEFVEEMIVRRFGASHVVEGRDFHFGSRRSGDIGLLNLLGLHFGFALHVVEAVELDLAGGRHRISSTLIRRLVAGGQVEEARQCMGRCFELHGSVIRGQGLGRKLEFPTVNLDPGQQVVPADGVYAGRAIILPASQGLDAQHPQAEKNRLEGATEDVPVGTQFPAAISIGHKPTVGPTGDKFIEAYLIDASGDFYDKHLAIVFLRRLRDQLKFDALEPLRQQIAQDVEQTRQITKDSDTAADGR